MAKKEKINENFNLSYSAREDQSGETLIDVNISFENPRDHSMIVDRLNTWLCAIGYSNLRVSDMNRNDSFLDDVRTAYDK